MKKIKRSFFNYVKFALFAIALLVFIGFFMYFGITDPENRVMELAGAAFLIIALLYTFYVFCSGDIYYDEFHLEFHTLTGKVKFSIRYSELKEIEYLIDKRGRGRDYYYNFYTNDNQYRIHDINRPDAFMELFGLAQRYNPDLNFTKRIKSWIKEKKEVIAGKNAGADISDSENSFIKSEVLEPTIELSDSEIEAYSRMCSDFVNGMIRVCYYDSSKSCYDKIIDGVSVPQSTLVIDIDTEAHYRALNIDESDGNISDVFPYTEDMRKAFEELKGVRPGFVFFYWNED